MGDERCIFVYLLMPYYLKISLVYMVWGVFFATLFGEN